MTQLPTFAASVTLAWNPSTDPTVVGYNIYYGGISATYTNEIPAGNVTNITISGLVPGATYYFAATTYNSADLESSLSSELVYQVPVTVVATNHPPTLNPIGNLTINENAGLQTVSLSGITSGATNENQTLTVTAYSSNTNLIPNPTVNYVSANTNGSLTFTPALNANGTATFTVTVNDGGASNNIIARVFTVTVNPVNQPPTLNPIGNLIINENGGLQTVNLYGITSGAANENQTLTVTVSSSNTGLIPNPTVKYTSPNTNGSLTFTPAINGNGTATITVKVNDGGASNNIIARVFNVTVNPVNQPPTLNPIGNLTINENAGLQTVNLSGITSGATNENQTLTVTSASGNTSLIPNPTVNYTSPYPAGTLTFTPVANTNGSVIITVTVNDGGTSNNIVAQNFTVTVLAVNDLTRPTAQITAPTSNQQWTNGTFTMTGKASDNVAVGAVYYALNGSGWSAATTTNGWTNWTGNLNLVAGTNTVQAYAVDTSGNLSPTNTVQFEYVVLKPLAVQVMGQGMVRPSWGTLNPSYTNGMLLAINQNYTLTANAAGGFGFTNWTDGYGNQRTNRATLQFTMVTNLTLKANFADVTKPTASIVSPTSNQQWTNGTFTMTGKASDNVAIATVLYSLNGSGYVAATTTNGWTNWTANLNLVAGTNTVQAYAVDTSGNLSPTNTVQFEYVVLQPLAVQVMGLGAVNPKWGTLNPNYTNGTLLAVNENYTLTANAAGGFAFTNWTDGIGTLLTNRATLQFTMVTNLTLRAIFVDATKPVVSIVSPTSNQQWTNGTFTMTGKASDNVAVSTVIYSLNGSSWASGTTTNGWTNWTANLNLVAGTNTVQAYAVDTSGNLSPTNTVQFEYVVLQPLAVQIMGLGVVNPKWGTLNPNYTNGTLLAINENYTLTANAAGGFAFTNWTDGSGTLLTNRATLQFTMVTNLTLRAIFVDVSKPTLSIVSPTSNQQWTNGTFTMTGKASDNVAISTVLYSLNGSGWSNAVTGNGWTNWTANLTLVPGTNTVRAYAVDTSGNLSPTNTVQFEYVVLQPLAVQVMGLGVVNPKWGTLNPNYTNGTLLAVNENYTLTANAAGGFAFTNWTDGSGTLLTNRATLQFTMETNVTLRANFVDITKPTVSIVSPTSNQQWTNGTFTMTGKASDNVAISTVLYSLNGSGWVAASTTNQWTNWTANLNLLPGTNTVRAYAVDTSGNQSPVSNCAFIYKSSPTIPAVLLSPAFGNGQYSFAVSGAPGYKYVIEVSTDLVNWVPVQTNTAPFNYVDTQAAQFSQRFYRSVYAP